MHTDFLLNTLSTFCVVKTEDAENIFHRCRRFPSSMSQQYPVSLSGPLLIAPTVHAFPIPPTSQSPKN